MANNYLQFSETLNLGSSKKVDQALKEYDEWAEKLFDGDEDVGFEMGRSDEAGYVWLSAEEGGDVEQAVGFVKKLAEKFDLEGLWSLTWAEWCSQPRVGEFGGGAVVLNLKTGEAQ
jgi:hypothetical protein